MRYIKIVVIAILLFYIMANLKLYFSQRDILFKPTHSAPSKKGFYLKSGKDKIWVETRNRLKKRAIIYFPGNSEKGWIDIETLANRFSNFSIYFLHYRGYGKSSSYPSQEHIYEDALTLYNYLKERKKDINIIGRSLGTAPAIYLASLKKDINKTVLITPFDSIITLGKIRYPFLLISLLAKDPFLNYKYAPFVNSPTLILLAQNDEVVPYFSSKKLIDSFKKKVEVVILNNSNHSTILTHPKFFSTILSFLNR